MTSRTLAAVALAVVLALATEASAQVPAALVEDVKSGSAGVEFMDYLTTGKVIKLQPRDVLVLSYLKSCEHETITGGTVFVGAEHSDVQGGKIVRAKVPCDGGKMQLTFQQASKSGATSFRDTLATTTDPTLYALPPVIQVNDGRTLVIERVDQPGERYEIAIGNALVRGAFYDLAKADKPLTRGAIYSASLGGRKITFKVDANAKSGKAPVISRLLRFPSS